MNKVIVIILALIGGLFGGFVLSEVIGIIGKLAFDRAVGIKFLPIYTALACTLIALIVLQLRRRSK